MDGKPVTRTDEVAAIERALLALRRSQTRRALARLSAHRGARSGRAARLPDAVFELLDAIDAAGDRAPAVTELAAALGTDQPRASRLTAQALDAGLVRRVADQADGRRSLLTLTPAGRRALEQIHAFRQQVVAEATTGWSSDDRAALARLLARFVDDFAAVTDSTRTGDRASPASEQGK